METEDDGQVYMYLAKSKSRDLCTWELPVKLTPRDQKLNYSSPGNVVWFEDRWLICLQTYCRENGEKYGNEDPDLFYGNQANWSWAQGRITAGFVMDGTGICGEEKLCQYEYTDIKVFPKTGKN